MAGAYPTIICYPPLEQLSVISAGQNEISFTVNIKWSICRSRYPFQVRLCTAGIGSPQHPSIWRSYPLSKSNLSTVAFREDKKWYSETFQATLSRQALAESMPLHQIFTVKYRISEDTAWQWITCPSGFTKGEIILQSPLSTHHDVETLVALAPGWHVAKVETTHKAASLFSIQSDPIQGPTQMVLGLLHHQARYCAISQIEPPWIAPRHGDDFLYLSERTVLCSILRGDGNVVTVAAPSISDVYTFLLSNERGEVTVHTRDDSQTGKPCQIMLSIAPDIETSISAIMNNLQAKANESPLVRDMIDDEFKSSNTNSSHLAPLLDYLGFCTWNALGPNLTQENILDALQLLREHDVKISTLLIDDNWQTLGSTELGDSHHDFLGFADFKASEGFPDGIAGLTASVKAENPSITEIGVWHGLLGYWGAIAKEGWIADNYETVDVDGLMYYAVPTKLKSISASALNQFYDDFYAYLASSGITFVKTDVQVLLSGIANSPDRASFIPAYQAAWTMAYQRRLGGKAISCMSQIPELMWQSLLQTKTAPVIFRNSDDFFPEIPSSHPWHIWVNAHNSLFTQHLNAVLDWDMFQTSMDYGPAHAASRCLSGGPIFITDVPGEHDLELIDQMVAPSPDGGRSMVLRPCEGAKSPRAFDRYQESGVLKVVTETTTGVKLMGVFNTRPTHVSTLISASEFATIGSSKWEPGAEVVFFSHQSQTVRGPAKLGTTPTAHSDATSLFEVDLDVKGFEILSGHVSHRVSYRGAECLVAALGLLGKMTGAAAICSCDVFSTGDEIKATISVKALGQLGFWIHGRLIDKSNVQAKLEAVDVDSESITVSNASHGESTAQLLTIDLVKEWSLKQHKTSLTEVYLELFIR
ncbi:hypothetical protein AK830_g263 [Neonectria ditissima]|uniref:Uncharacterized protein n=1 Tax=Neonectria ditissima TaxID=78410 RepID=A0A0P7BYH4_9HYPO|nr:hypothetical protein AK830_g263 [Neonectria ditissima]